MSKFPSHEPAARRAANIAYREKNKEKLRAYEAARYKQRYAKRKLIPLSDEQKQAVREKTAAWRKKYPDRAKEMVKKWREENPQWVAPHRLDRAAVNAKWRASYKAKAEYYRQKAREKRIRRFGADGSHTEEEWVDLVRYFGNSCVYCGAGGKMTRDHVIPLSRKELNPTDYIQNILPACGPCNARKKDKTDWEYRLWMFKRGPVLCFQNA